MARQYKTEIIGIRCSKMELRLIQKFAEKSNLKISEFARTKMLEGIVPRTKILDDEEMQILKVLKTYQTNFSRVSSLIKNHDLQWHSELKDLANKIGLMVDKILKK